MSICILDEDRSRSILELQARSLLSGTKLHRKRLCPTYEKNVLLNLSFNLQLLKLVWSNWEFILTFLLFHIFGRNSKFEVEQNKTLKFNLRISSGEFGYWFSLPLLNFVCKDYKYSLENKNWLIWNNFSEIFLAIINRLMLHSNCIRDFFILIKKFFSNFSIKSFPEISVFFCLNLIFIAFSSRERIWRIYI